MANLLRAFQFHDWWVFNAQPHVKLYSLSFAVSGPFVGFNIVGAESVNLILYLLIVVAVYVLARELFESKTAMIAAGLAAIWPSLLLHTTQLLRDPVFILSLLLFALVLVVALKRSLSFVHGLLIAIAGVGTSLLLWLIRGDMWELIFLMLVIGILMNGVGQLRRRRFLPGNTIVGLALLSAAFLIPKTIPTYRQQDSALQTTKEMVASPTGSARPLPQAVFGRAEPTSNTGLARLAQRVGVLRHKFIIQYPLAGSNIDTHVELFGLKDVLLYFPRAMQVGLFAPFPRMWFTRGAQVGWQGRLWSGIETLCIYGLTVLAIACIALNRRQLSVWLILLLIILGCTALGYVVVNISALYRMRYGYWVMLMILGVKGFVSMTTRWRAGSESRQQDNAAVRQPSACRCSFGVW